MPYLQGVPASKMILVGSQAFCFTIFEFIKLYALPFPQFVTILPRVMFLTSNELQHPRYVNWMACLRCASTKVCCTSMQARKEPRDACQLSGKVMPKKKYHLYRCTEDYSMSMNRRRVSHGNKPIVYFAYISLTLLFAFRVIS